MSLVILDTIIFDTSIESHAPKIKGMVIGNNLIVNLCFLCIIIREVALESGDLSKCNLLFAKEVTMDKIYNKILVVIILIFFILVNVAY